MPINLSIPENTELAPRITVVGVGGAGGNAVNNMINAELEGVDFVVCNTDAQAISQSRAERRVQLGAAVTQGLGAGAQPEIGRAAAEETTDELLEHLQGSNMVFVTAGMGGGTGTRRGPGHRPTGSRAGNPDRRRGHQAVPFRGHAPACVSRNPASRRCRRSSIR